MRTLRVGEHVLVNLGTAYEELGQYDKAKDVLERALKIRRAALWAGPFRGDKNAHEPGQYVP